MPDNRIILDDDQKLKIYMSPMRQKIIRHLAATGKASTAKQIADILDMTPSSAKHHLEKLASIGIVVFDHYEFVRGIRAVYYRLTDATISIGQNVTDESAQSRDAFMMSQLSLTSGNYQAVVSGLRREKGDHDFGTLPPADMISGIVHLDDEQAAELWGIIDEFIKSHAYANDAKDKQTNPWEFVLVGYRKDLALKYGGKE